MTKSCKIVIKLSPDNGTLLLLKYLKFHRCLGNGARDKIEFISYLNLTLLYFGQKTFILFYLFWIKHDKISQSPASRGRGRKNLTIYWKFRKFTSRERDWPEIIEHSRNCWYLTLPRHSCFHFKLVRMPIFD